MGGVRIDGQRNSHFNRGNHTAAGTGPRRAPGVARGDRAQGERAGRRFIEFFTATIRNRNTRMAYARAVKQFFDWCEDHRLGLEDIEPIAISAYIEELGSEIARPSVKQHLAALRQLFDYLE